MSDNSVRGLTALVTGAGGFLGSHLCKRLLDGGAEVYATSRIKRSSEHRRLHWCQDDLTQFRAVQKLLEETRPEIVFHLAGQVTAAPELSLMLPTFNSLLQSTVNLLAAATAVTCRRLVVTGSLTEPEPDGLDVVPSSPYAAAKWASTAYARMCHKLYGTPVVILRPFMAYGPGQSREKLIPHVTLSLLKGKPPKLASGQWMADWVYVDDVIDGFMLAASQPAIDGCTIDLGSGIMTSTREVVNHLVRITDTRIQPEFGSIADRPAERVRSADMIYAKEKLGWEPQTSLDQGLARTVNWYRDQLSNLSGEQQP
jgi:UDP-glucose 4-epimerase